MRPKILPMTETVDTSSKGIVTSDFDYFKFVLPWNIVNKVGIRWNDEVKIYQESVNSKEFFISVLPLDKPDLYQYTSDVRFQKLNGWAGSKDLHREVDDVYLLLPKEFLLHWEHNQDVEYTYIHEVDGEERHVQVKHSDYSS